jgi:hypothetical protein
VSRLGRYLRPAISLAAIGLIVWWVTGQSEPRVPTGARGLGLLALALILYAGVTAVRGERWHRLLRRRRIPARRRDSYALTTVGYMGNNLLPARAGDLLRVYLLAGRTHMGKREGLGTVLGERVLDALALVGIFGVATVSMLIEGRSADQGPALLVAGILAGVGALGAGALAVLLHPRWGSARARGLLLPLLASLRDLAGTFGLRLLGISVVIWILEASVYLTVGQALGLHVSLEAAIYVMAFANIAGLLPAGPGYIGTYDAAVLLAARAFSIVGGSAVSFLLLLRFALFVPITIVGLLLQVTRYSGWHRIGLRTLRAPRADARV